jgi:hypothetical protein
MSMNQVLPMFPIAHVLRTAPLRGHDLAKRGEAQGGRGRCAEGRTIRHVYSLNKHLFN